MGSMADSGLPRDLVAGMRSCPKQIPCAYLYDRRGSELYEEITALEEYYPFKTEQALLTQHAADIIAGVPPGAVVVELGCGSACKTGILLTALLARDGPEHVRFLGIDVSQGALEEAADNLLARCPGLRANHMELVCEEYIAGLREARRRHPDAPLCVLWLGSSVGNLAPADARAFFTEALAAAGPKSQILLCTDLWKDATVLHAAYCDGRGVTEEFIRNGLAHALRRLRCAGDTKSAAGAEGHGAGGAAAANGHYRAFSDVSAAKAAMDDPADAFGSNWTYEVVVNDMKQQVEMWLRCARGLHLFDGVSVAPGERLLMEVSRKFTPARVRALAHASGWFLQAAWANSLYSMQLLLPPGAALESCWADTDALFERICDWGAHPIDVRHPFCFYYGHVAAFAKLKMLPEVAPTAMDIMLSRGIDPNLADPSRCHAHPDVPATWPSRQQLQDYVGQVREELRGLVAGGRCPMRALCLALEHERMHQETLGYMLAQEQKRQFEDGADSVAPPAGMANGHGADVDAPDRVAPEWPEFVAVAGGKVALGIDVSGGGAGFVWDNEGPPQPPARVGSFLAGARPVSVAQFRAFALGRRGYAERSLWDDADWPLFGGRGREMPATWSLKGGELYVHGPDGKRHWSEVADQPVYVSLAEAAAYCRWAGARLMTEPEWHLALQSDPDGTRVRDLCRGGWEWTATPFAPFPGFAPMAEYPEYSTDFFDGVHYVLKGSAPVTHSSVVRASFRNYYQRQYPYVFAKFRCCADADARHEE